MKFLKCRGRCNWGGSDWWLLNVSSSSCANVGNDTDLGFSVVQYVIIYWTSELLKFGCS